MKIKFDTKNNEKQKECARAWVDPKILEIVYGGSKGSAKSYTGVSLTFGDALIYPGTHYFIARKTLTDLRKFTIPSIHEVFGHWGLTEQYYKYNGQDSYFKLYNDSRVYLLDAKFMPSDPDYMRFGSMQMTRGWIEEAGEFEVECKRNLQASIGRWKNDLYNLSPKLLMTCNPAKNFLYKDYYKPFVDGDLRANRKFIQALPRDNKMLPKDYITNLLDILDHNAAQRLVYGNWEFDDNPNALFAYNDILNIFTNEFLVGTGEMALTADIAYEGSDIFVMMVWNGFVVVDIVAIDKCDETQVAVKIKELRLKWAVPLTNVVYDADGLKTFVKQAAESGTLKDATPFINNSSPIEIEGKEENYYNLKAQCYFLLAEMVKKNKIFIKCPEYRKQIIEELEQIMKMTLADDGKIRLEKKKDLKERFKRSPDFADALMMRMLLVLKSPNSNNPGRWSGGFR